MDWVRNEVAKQRLRRGRWVLVVSTIEMELCVVFDEHDGFITNPSSSLFALGNVIVVRPSPVNESLFGPTT